MYANQFAAGRGFRPGSMTAALAMTALPIVGLFMAAQRDKIARLFDPPIKVITIDPIKDPPPDPQPKKQVDPNPIKETTYVPPIPPVAPSDNKTATSTDLFPPRPPQPEVGTGTVIAPPPPIAKAVVVGAAYDPHYNNVLQPPYPASEIRSGNAGRVVLRVLIGTDGRVRQVERVSAASDAFFASAERQALTRWRFKPATSDGMPIEQWKTMSLRFELKDQE